MNAESSVSVLVCKDAGTAGRTLLGRQDVRVRWALTAAEAESVIYLTKCGVCITRESLAKQVLAACARSGRRIATIVLLEPAQWSSWRDYFEAGATSVLQATANDQLLDALSDATGLSFRTAPRVPFRTEVRFALGEEGGSWRSLNLSATGICIVDFPSYALGSEVDLTFEIAGKWFEVNAVVSQMLRAGARRAVGLAFRDVSPELQANIDDVITSTPIPTLTEPVDDFDALDEGTVMALRSSSVNGDSLDLMRRLTTAGTVTRADTAAEWLVAACNALSSTEVAAVQNPQAAPPWAQDAVLGRIRVYQARSRARGNAPSDTDVREIFGLCQRLSDDAAGSDGETLVQVTNVRAEILRALYDPDLLESPES